jgi:glycosyltransferase involved in cell wall biosynthesis
VCILGLDTVRPKTLYQTRWLAERGFGVDIFTMHRDTDSIAADASAAINVLPSNPLTRAAQTARYLASRRGHLHHVELYVGGRFAFVHALLARLFGIPLLVIERGDILLVSKRAYSASMRLSIRLCYRLANRVWYREVYMTRMLESMGARETFLLPNAVPVPPEPPSDATRTVDLLWLNRMIPERHPDEFARVLARIAAERPVTASLVGLSADVPAPRVREMEDAVRETLEGVVGVTLFAFSDPEPHYASARFFVLHGEIVFANFALLEAMARGVVPIVSGVEGADRIVRDGLEGLVYPPGEDGLEQALQRALHASAQQWQEWSRAARTRILEQFSLDAWGRRLLEEYETLAPGRAGSPHDH